jgi:DNA sulfur modification protein DndD
MKFSNIEINNFRQYHNSVNVDLETNGEKNIIIIGGRNGYGKTNFFIKFKNSNCFFIGCKTNNFP